MSAMTDPRIPLKNRWLAALLAFLIPGAGHLYQGRTFKGMLYLVCIMGTFSFGMHLSEGKAVAYQSAASGKRNLGYFAQLGVGIPVLYAVVQSKRFDNPRNRPIDQLDAPLSQPFRGRIVRRDNNGHATTERISGRIELKPVRRDYGPDVEGVFTGTSQKNEPVKLKLAGNFRLGPQVNGSELRRLQCAVVEEQDGRLVQAGTLEGAVPRPFLDWFEAPMDNETEQDLNRRLEKRLEIALVYTWIAGLLNILAIWDALDGPAYGYGDEQDDDRDDADDANSSRENAKIPETSTAGAPTG